MGSQLKVWATIAWTIALVPARAAEDPATLRKQGYELAYNLDHDEALKTFERAVALDPNDVASHRAIAAVTWMNITIFQRGAITVDDFLGSVSKPNVPVEPAPPEQARLFHTHMSSALELAEARVRASPRSADAHYQLGSVVGILTSYQAIVEGKALGAFRTARRAYQEHEEVLRLDPSRRDAGLVVGSYRYVVANLPLPLRLMAYVVGFGGGREEGIRMVEQAAAFSGDVQPEARFLLILLYNREQRYDEALRIVRELQRAYPRNRFLWLNGAGTALRARKPEEAMRFMDEGWAAHERDRRPRARGEEGLWYYLRGAAHVAMGRTVAAREALARAETLDPRPWVRGRLHLERGKLGDLEGDRTRAVQDYRRAQRLCEDANDGWGAEEARRLARSRYTAPGRR